ncbi:MAG: DmsC/YnfH family molybdoenzyme membrane anchor subunit [Thermodesulfobacteriota bacterium]
MEEFVVGFRVNQRFNHLVAANFTLEGSGAALFLGALFLGCRSCLLEGLIMALLGALALFLDLGSPGRSWRSVYRPGRSWISRGAFFLTGLVVLGLLYTLVPLPAGDTWGVLLKAILAALALLTALYTGFLVSSMEAIPFWRSWLVPPLFLLQSLATGLLVLYFSVSLIGPVQTAPALPPLIAVFLIGAAVLNLGHLTVITRSGPAARESVHRLLRGELKAWFWGGAVILGYAAPLILLIGFAGDAGGWSAGSSAAMLLAAAARIVGDFSFRWTILRTGVYEPVLV